MAKTFKNLPRPGELTASKPTSERDFFDLSDEREPVKKLPQKPESASNTGNTSNVIDVDNIGNIGNIGNTDKPASIISASAS